MDHWIGLAQRALKINEFSWGFHNDDVYEFQNVIDDGSTVSTRASWSAVAVSESASVDEWVSIHEASVTSVIIKPVNSGDGVSCNR